MASNDAGYIANTILNSDIPVPWCEEFEKMINGKKSVHDLADLRGGHADRNPCFPASRRQIRKSSWNTSFQHFEC